MTIHSMGEPGLYSNQDTRANVDSKELCTPLKTTEGTSTDGAQVRVLSVPVAAPLVTKMQPDKEDPHPQDGGSSTPSPTPLKR